MKIILSSLNSKFIHSNLAIRYLKSFANEYEIEIFEATINENPLDIAIRILGNSPDIIGFSCYIWNIENTLKVCSVLKEIKRDMKIVLGGPEVSYDGEGCLKNYEYIDYIVEGEGEITFKELLNALHGRKQITEVDGIIFRDNGEIMRNCARVPIKNLDILEFPYKDGVSEKIVYYEASRGCPFSCRYCLSSITRGVRYFSIERVKRDLQYFIENNVKLVKFVDRTFNADKKFAKEIWSFLIENHKSTSFHFEIAGDLFDEESFEILKRAPSGLFQFEIGVQTTNPEILRNINRVMDFELVKENLNRIRKNKNIHCHLDLIAGLPREDITSFRKSFDMCMNLIPDVLQPGFLKILKGSPMQLDAHKYDMRYTEFPPYQVLATKDIPFEDMERLIRIEKVFDIYYNSRIFNLTMHYVLPGFESSFDFFENFSMFLKKREFFNKNFDLREKFLFLFEFLSCKIDKEVLKGLLLHDYVINTKKASIPDFLKKVADENIKEIIMQNKDKIYKHFGIEDLKKIVFFPCDVKTFWENERLFVQKTNTIIVFSIISGEYLYI